MVEQSPEQPGLGRDAIDAALIVRTAHATRTL